MVVVASAALVEIVVDVAIVAAMIVCLKEDCYNLDTTFPIQSCSNEEVHSANSKPRFDLCYDTVDRIFSVEE